jgi:DEAD/DEAH box helicase domain-containing protein
LKPYARKASGRSFNGHAAGYIPNLELRLSLDSIAEPHLERPKPPTGQSMEWFRNGELEKVAEYCKADVYITRRIYEFGRTKVRTLLFKNGQQLK